jgi:hypothetical protein
MSELFTFIGCPITVQMPELYTSNQVVNPHRNIQSGQIDILTCTIREGGGRSPTIAISSSELVKSRSIAFTPMGSVNLNGLLFAYASRLLLGTGS